MRNLKALLQTYHVEGLNYKQEVFKYLPTYRSMPHPSTGKTPAELLFNGRPCKTQLPTLVSKVVPMIDESFKHSRFISKKKNKEYSDSHRNTDKYEPLKVGDCVLVQQAESSKLKRSITSPRLLLQPSTKP